MPFSFVSFPFHGKTDMTSTPFLNLPKDSTMWLNEENSWWRLNLDHAWLKEGKPVK